MIISCKLTKHVLFILSVAPSSTFIKFRIVAITKRSTGNQTYLWVIYVLLPTVKLVGSGSCDSFVACTFQN